MKPIIFSILLLLLPFGMSYGQIPTFPQSLPSPTAAGLGLYGEVPVSLFTGIPSIQIPLFEFQVDGHSFPLTLNYHASGVRPDQHVSWTGLGWSLNAGGVITRVVNDAPDDYDNPKYYLGGKRGYYFNHSVLNTDRWNRLDYIRGIAQEEKQRIKDTEPDIFSFNFLGYSGKFMLTHEGKWKVQCDKPVKVELYNGFLTVPFEMVGGISFQYGNTPSFAGFTLTTEDGTCYVFGGTTASIEYSIDFFAQDADEWKAVSWYLTEIIYPSGKKVTLSYERGSFICQMYIGLFVQQYVKIEHADGTVAVPGCNPPSFSRHIDDNYGGKLISPVYLADITSPDFIIQFECYETDDLRYGEEVFRKKTEKGVTYPYLESHTGETGYLTGCLQALHWYRLAGIWIIDSTGETTRDIQFSYRNVPTERLLLTSVTDCGYDYEGNSKTYRFEYEQPEKLPGYLSNKVDHWGFYNNREAPLDDFSKYHQRREPNASVLTYGMLKKIVYPTGGYTRFVFEPHDYRKRLAEERWKPCEELEENQTAGGVRIRKVINSATGNETDEVVSREYFYTTDYLQTRRAASLSSGVLGGQTKYEFGEYVLQDVKGENIKHFEYLFSTQSVLPGCENSLGSHIGYTEVVEKRADGSFTRYRFTNFDNGHLDKPADTTVQLSHTPYEPYSSTSVERGHVILQEEYTSDGTLKMKKEITYEKSSGASDDFVRSMKAVSHLLCGSYYEAFDEGSAYRVNMYSYRMASETETSYDNPAHPLSVSTGYAYNSDGLLCQKSRSVNAGVKHVSYKYPSDFPTGVYQTMTDKHVLSPVVEEKEELEIGNLLLPLWRDCYSYVPLKGGTERYFGPEKVERSIGGGALKEKIVCLRRDARGNPVHLRENGNDVVYLWGYHYRYLVAEIKNATAAQVERYLGDIDSFAAADIPDLQRLAQLRALLHDGLVTTYTHNPIGVTSVTDPSGKTTYYQYDHQGRLSSERDSRGEIRKMYDYRYSNQ